MFSFVALALASALAVSAADLTVLVGDGGSLAFSPTQVTAQVGDTIHFEFRAKNHSVTQSTFASPCTLSAGGIDSGFQLVQPNATEFPSWSFTLNNASAPLWFHCAQTSPVVHCQAGMVFAVNPTADKSFNAFQANANGTSSGGAASGGAASTGVASGTGAAPLPSASGFSTSLGNPPSTSDPAAAASSTAAAPNGAVGGKVLNAAFNTRTLNQMYSFLPDELLKEILAPALQVPDDSFACTNGQSPFSNYNQTTSAYLLVCKDWLRVATPLLYSVVVLRSKAQMQALESAIKLTPILATFIKKLRVESGYCVSLSAILKGAKNLTDLCLSMEVYSSDNVSAICKSFAFIHPRRLIIYDLQSYRKGHQNQKAQQLVKTIQEYITKWDKLTTVVLPAWTYWRNQQKMEDFIAAISKSSSIEVVSVHFQYSYPSWFDSLVETPHLKKIILRDARSQDTTPFNKAISTRAKLKNIVFWDRDSEADDASKSETGGMPRKSVVPINWLQTFPDSVWINIFSYSLGLRELEHPYAKRAAPSCGVGHWRHLACVCKRFYGLVKPLSRHCISVQWEPELHHLASFLAQNKEAGKQVKTLLISSMFRHSNILAQSLNELLSFTPHLRCVSTLVRHGVCDIFDWQALSTLAQNAGPELLNLAIYLHRPPQSKSPDIFYQFTALRHIDFASSTSFSFNPTDIQKEGLPNIESITSKSTNNSFLAFLSCMDLPKLHQARFPEPAQSSGAITFLRKHGPKLQTLELGFLPGACVFDTCPNITVFELPSHNPGVTIADFFFSSHRHPLEILHIQGGGILGPVAEKEKLGYIGDLDLTNFTSLHHVKIDKCRWPTTEHEIKRSHWVAWAERLKESYGVDVVDSEGRKWVPRLRARSRK
ncbi:hypothetical protein P691DRAFT_775816 [Macrolepiota fuliginosa MF-IS2]|uniref:Cupredoxin n=1 Tax=Macrolepiota fuliginosa MF-IS2 TaxID=1400762 RepID=A0A9P5XBC1_9AGAR|nr:hypothetical protein P691DRAFT_775816 [Macrolepiota fuliginosa MF-IS2]